MERKDLAIEATLTKLSLLEYIDKQRQFNELDNRILLTNHLLNKHDLTQNQKDLLNVAKKGLMRKQTLILEVSQQLRKRLVTSDF